MNRFRVSSQMIRFGSIGVLNTLTDFAIFHVLANQLGVPFYLANVISTAAALGLSFVLNARYAFNSRLTKRNALLFVVVTLAGLWLLQPVVILMVRPFLGSLLADTFNDEILLLMAKLFATVASLTWNYILYKNVVFRTSSQSDISHRQ